MITAFLLAGVLLTAVDTYSANEVIQGDVTTVYTPNVYAYKYFDLQVVHRDFVVFSVRACSDIHVALMQLWADTSANITENVIGGWSNTLSVYRNGVPEDQRHYLDVDTPNIAHCTEFRTFWISWGSDRLRTGTGPIPNEQTFMELQRTADITHPILFVAFSTGFGVTGVWKVPENQGYYMDIFTPDDFRYQYVWKSTQFKNNQFRFYVQACHDVHINLSPNDGAVYYEAVLGGWNNTMSVIRMANVHMQEYLESGIVQCNDWRQFWITWTEATIRVGKGSELFQSTFLEWNDPNFVGVNHLSFSCGYGSTGNWVFNEDLENAFKYYTQEETVTSHQEFRLILSTVDRQNVIFDVKACSDVWIAMSSVPEDVEEFAHQIYLGVENNTKSGVRIAMTPQPIVEVQTVGILHCSYVRTFWISWSGSQRQMGAGTTVGTLTFLTWADDTSNLVSTVAFSNAHQAGSHYLLRRNAGDSLMVLTPKLYTYHSMWQSVIQDVMFTFRVRACQDIYVAMSGLLGVADKETYELIIGSCYVSFIRDASDVSNPIVEASTPDILSCSLYRSFWISWLGGFIRVGKGSIYGRSAFLQLPNAKPHPINAISVSTSLAEGSWEFETDTGDQVTIVTPNNNGNMKWLHLHSSVRWFHFQVQGSGARLVLSADYRDSTNAYHIAIGSKRNTEYAIYRGSVLVMTSSESSILSVDDFKEFWLSWDGGLIQLGRTKYRAVVPALVSYQDPQPMAVKAVAVHGGSQSYGDWKFSTNIASELSIWTERYQSYESWLSLKHRTSMVFALHTCSHAEILLSAVPFLSMETDFVYVVVLQDPNDMTSIWRGNRNKKMAEHHTPNILSCNEEKHFWLSWYGGHICLGHGRKKGENMIVSYQDLNPSPILAVSFSSFEVAGGWRIPLHSDGFVALSSADTSSQSLDGGEIAGIVIGSLAMICLFLFMVFVILVGPENVFDKCRNITGRGGGGGEASSKATAVSSSSFDNPLTVTEFSEINIA